MNHFSFNTYTRVMAKIFSVIFRIVQNFFLSCRSFVCRLLALKTFCRTKSEKMSDTSIAFRLSRRRQCSIRRRIFMAFVWLGLATSTLFIGVGWLAYEHAVSYLIRWHMEPVMRLLVAAEEEKIKSGTEASVSGQDLAWLLGLSLRTGNAIPSILRPAEMDEKELVRLERDLYALSYRSEAGHDYVIEGEIEDFDDLEEILAYVFAGFLAVSLIIAGFIGLILSHEVVSPLLALAHEIREERPLENSSLCRREDETGFLARSFAEREKSLRAYLAREQLFTGDVSHELRTPLTIMRGSVEVLESLMENSPHKTLSSAVLQPQLERMQRTLHGMTNMVHTMLLLARSPEQVRNTRVDLSEVVRQCTRNIKEELSKKNIAFHAVVPDNIYVPGQTELAALVVSNLLENACRYTEEGSIRITLTCDIQQHHVLYNGELTIIDTAPSIPEDLRVRMFERGARGHGRVPGSGFGLALVLRACEHMGWAVSHQRLPDLSEEKHGNCFVVHFPCTQATVAMNV